MRIVCLLMLGAMAAACTPAVRPSIAAAIAAPDRPKVDVDRDADRRPAALLAFAGIKPGDRIADIMPGEGYFTRIFSHAVGPKGQVFAIVPNELAQVAPKLGDSARALGGGNVTVSFGPTISLTAPVPLDLAWTSNNYHDLYAFFGPEQAAAFDVAVFAMLRPGGTFIVIDHRAAPGIDRAGIRRLHRIDPAIVRAQAEAAGFVFEGESAILTNPADGHDLPVFDPAIRGHTDQFVLKFRKPR